MKLLFDQNISFRIVKKLEDVFPEAKQVAQLDLYNSSDIEIWNFAKENDFAIVTFDSDFIDISTLKGHPPKIVWLRYGNTSTENIAEALRKQQLIISEFLSSTDESAFLELK